jgi:hypothetical protein
MRGILGREISTHLTDLALIGISSLGKDLIPIKWFVILSWISSATIFPART